MNDLRKNQFRNKVVKNAVFLTSIFMLGIVVGHELDNNAIKWIQGFSYSLFDGSATNSNATDCNATDSNATSSNATSSNATSSNATNSNVNIPTFPNINDTSDNDVTTEPSENVDLNNQDQSSLETNPSDEGTGTSTELEDVNAQCSGEQANSNYIKLEKLSISKEEFIPGEAVYLSMATSGACYNAGIINFTDHNEKEFSVDIKKSQDKTYFIVPDNISDGKYYVESIELSAVNGDNVRFTSTISGRELTELNTDTNNNHYYIVVKDDVDVQATEKIDEVVTFQKSNKVNILLIVLGFGFVILLLVIMFIVNKKNKELNK